MINLEEFNKLYLPVLDLSISGLGLISVIYLIKQYRKDNRWQKLQSSYNFIGIGEELDLQERLYKLYDQLEVYSFPEICRPLTKDQVVSIKKDREATVVTNMFLNHLQNICTAYNFGLIDKKVFAVIHSGRILWWYKVLNPYIEERSIDYANDLIWCEFTALAKKIEQ